MTREQHLERLKTYDLTKNQLGAIMGEWRRLGFSTMTKRPWYVPKDELWLGRPERLDITSCLVGRDIDSTWELKMGEAGELYNTLQHTKTLEELFKLLPEDFEFSPEEDDEDEEIYIPEDDYEEEQSPGQMFRQGWQLISKAMSSWLTKT